MDDVGNAANSPVRDVILDVTDVLHAPISSRGLGPTCGVPTSDITYRAVATPLGDGIAITRVTRLARCCPAQRQR